MSRRFSDLSLRAKLLALGVLPSALVLFIAAVGFVVYDLISYKQSLSRDLSGTAHFIALTTRASLRFDNEEYARRILSGLESNRDIIAAGVYNEAGQLFVDYFGGRDPASELPTLQVLQESESRNRVRVFAPVVLNEQQIGTVYMEATYGSLWQRFAVLSGGLIAASILLVLVAYWLSSRLQWHITKPLASLTQTARSISQHKDYSVRAESQKDREFAVVTDAFNHMLQQIESQDAELRRRTDELQRTNKELEAFTYTVSHDLRGPLRSLSGYSQILLRKFAGDLPSEAQNYLERLQHNAQRMGDLIDDLLAFSHIDAELLKKRELDPGIIAEDAFKELYAQEKDRTVHFQLDTLPRVSADGALLRQVYINLLSNALKYTRPRAVAEIHAGARTDNGQPVFFVQDNGVGFDLQYAPSLFRVFQRLHKAEDFEGTGVGLAIVQRIIQRHGGKIWVDAAPDNGATFYFTLN